MNRDVWDRIKVLLKSFGTEKNSLDAVWKLLYTAIGYISSIFTFAVLLKDLAGFDKAEILCKNYWLGLVLIGIVVSFIHNHEKISCKGTMEDADLQIAFHINCN